MRWWRRLSLRSRLIALGSGGLAVGYALGGLLLLAVLHAVLQRSVDNGVRQTAQSLAQVVTHRPLSDPVPTAGGQIVQVLDSDHLVRAASAGGDRLTPLLRGGELTAAEHGRVVQVDGARAGLSGPLRVAAVDANVPGDPRVVLVAAPAGDVAASVRTVGVGLLLTYPVLLAVLGVVAWRIVGWTLRPVEQLRSGAEEIAGSDRARLGRLPVPEGDDELHRLGVTLNGMLERLDGSRRRQRAFVADAAHELRSPLASLRAQLEVSQRLGEPAPPGELLPDVERLARLVDDLLLLARADDSDPALRRETAVDVRALLAECVTRDVEGRVAVEARPGGPLWTVGDPTALRRVLDNLVSNAVRHASSRVFLDASTVDRYVLVTVADDGPGIPEADRGKVFDRFTRLDDGRNRDEGGAGLGLAIVRELVRLHGGTIELGDAGPGLRVTVKLPKREPFVRD